MTRERFDTKRVKWRRGWQLRKRWGSGGLMSRSGTPIPPTPPNPTLPTTTTPTLTPSDPNPPTPTLPTPTPPTPTPIPPIPTPPPDPKSRDPNSLLDPNSPGLISRPTPGPQNASYLAKHAELGSKFLNKICLKITQKELK